MRCRHLYGSQNGVERGPCVYGVIDDKDASSGGDCRHGLRGNLDDLGEAPSSPESSEAGVVFDNPKVVEQRARQTRCPPAQPGTVLGLGCRPGCRDLNKTRGQVRITDHLARHERTASTDANHEIGLEVIRHDLGKVSAGDDERMTETVHDTHARRIDRAGVRRS